MSKKDMQKKVAHQKDKLEGLEKLAAAGSKDAQKKVAKANKKKK